MSCATWLKLYPVLIFGFWFLCRPSIRFGAKLAIALLLPALVALPIIPVRLYQDYFFTILPFLSNHVTTAILNQSLIADVLRFLNAPDVAASFGSVPVPSVLKLLDLTLLMALIGFLTLRFRHDLFTGTILLTACFPVFSPYGWAHAFTMALPVLGLTIAYALSAGWIVRTVALAAFASFVWPAYTPVPAVIHLPDFVCDLFYSRYAIAVVAMGALIMFQSRTVGNVRASD